jgi:hypothetical protein
VSGPVSWAHRLPLLLGGNVLKAFPVWLALVSAGAVVSSSAASADPGSDLTTPEGRQAEYVRLAEEMGRKAKKNNWVAVERTFGKLDAMGIPHSFTVLWNAAHAARHRGDILAARERLKKAAKIEENEDVANWLWDIQQDYGPVMVAADLPANYRLVPKKMPFEPTKRKAVEFGVKQVLENSYFDGLLPRGVYTFEPLGAPDDSPLSFDFTLRADRQRFDLRTREEPTRADRRKRARIDRKLEKQRQREEASTLQ